MSALNRRRLLPLLGLPFAVACGAGAAQSTPNAAAPASSPATPAAPALPTTAPVIPTAAPTAATQPTTAPQQPTTAPAAPVTFKLQSSASQAIFRVREQLAGRSLPNDAEGKTNKVSGQLVLQPDGTFAQAASKISVDMTSLATDNSMRDQFIKQNTLQTGRFPTAEFVPTKIEGLAAPLPSSGEHSFKLTGLLTVKGVQKEITWDVTAKRDNGALNGKATTAFKFGDFGMTTPRVASVLSIVDEIRLEINLVASQAS
jgi:polyisoprenoid-binding protein YceI